MTNTPNIDDLLGTLSPAGPVIEGNGAALAQWLGMSERQIARLAQEGRAVRLGRNRYDLQASVLAYLKWLRDQVPAGRSATGSARTRLSDERERLVREQADAVALKNAQSRGELVPSAEVEREWANVLRDVRAAMLAVPSRVQSRIGHLTIADVAAIDREVRDALTEMAQPDAKPKPELPEISDPGCAERDSNDLVGTGSGQKKNSPHRGLKSEKAKADA